MQGNRDVHRRPLINILPVELLSEIFVIVAWMARQTATPTGWMQVLLVCKLWNDVASDIAELWRVIYVNSNQDWLRLCLTPGRASFIIVTSALLQPFLVPRWTASPF